YTHTTPHYTTHTLHYTTHTTPHYTTLHYTTHYTLHYTTLHHAVPHYTHTTHTLHHTTLHTRCTTLHHTHTHTRSRSFRLTHVAKCFSAVGQLQDGTGVVVHRRHLAALQHLAHALALHAVQHSAPRWQEVAAQGQAHLPVGGVHVQHSRHHLEMKTKMKDTVTRMR